MLMDDTKFWDLQAGVQSRVGASIVFFLSKLLAG